MKNFLFLFLILSLLAASCGGGNKKTETPEDAQQNYENQKALAIASFRRKGDDIYLEVPVSIYESALGKKIDVPTIDGSAEMTLPSGVQNGAKLRLKGKGVTNLKTKARGDQYVEIKLVMPDKITDDEKKKFEELEKDRPYNPRTKFERYMK